MMGKGPEKNQTDQSTVKKPFQAYDGDEPYVFVCYAHADAELVYQELTWLRDHGINIWYDEGITPGEEFPERLGNAVLGASLVLFYVSPRSVSSRHCRNEVFFALDRDVPVLSIFTEETELPAGLALSTGTAQAIMRHEMPPAVYCRKLLSGINDHSDLDNKIDVDPEKLVVPFQWKRLRPIAWTAGTLAGLALLSLAGLKYMQHLDHQEDIAWAREEAMPQIRAMLEDRWRDYTEPFELAVRAEEIIPDDPELKAILQDIAVLIDVDTTPPGAKVSYRKYSTPEAEWNVLGTTPIRKTRLPIGIFRWKFELEGHETVLAAASTWDISLVGEKLIQPNNITRTMDPVAEIPTGMVRVQGAETPQGYIDDFFIDRFEVTNAQYQEFVDAGGYQNPDFWEHEFVLEGASLSWEDGIARFMDATDRPGPSTWVGGHFPDRLGDHPVTGVSWYEAAAYSKFAGKELPSSFHWGLARGEYSPVIDFPQLGGFAIFAPYSNIGGNGTVPVGSLPGLGVYGAYDLAGNVREWCSNRASVGYVVRGGSWDDNPYDFAYVVHAPAMERSPGYGFRTAFYPERNRIPPAVFADIETDMFSGAREPEPVPEEIFEVYRNQFAYDPVDLDARIIQVDESHPDWILERVSVATPYGDDRIIINLFLPRDAEPPFQTVIYLPGSAALFQQDSEDIANYYEVPLFLSFLMRSGRAVVLPTYQGTFERHDERYPPMHMGARSHAFTDFIIQVVKDFRRTVDYLETRDDVDMQKLAFYGMSWGGWLASIVVAIEDRISTMILLAGGVLDVGLPEINPMTYMSHVDKPMLMMNGKYDTILNFEHSAQLMYDHIATPEAHKRLRIYPTDHIPPRNEFVREILDWLDHYFGPVARG